MRKIQQHESERSRTLMVAGGRAAEAFGESHRAQIMAADSDE